jgi:hypothetical protein
VRCQTLEFFEPVEDHLQLPGSHPGTCRSHQEPFSIRKHVEAQGIVPFEQELRLFDSELWLRFDFRHEHATIDLIEEVLPVGSPARIPSTVEPPPTLAGTDRDLDPMSRAWEWLDEDVKLALLPTIEGDKTAIGREPQGAEPLGLQAQFRDLAVREQPCRSVLYKDQLTIIRPPI